MSRRIFAFTALCALLVLAGFGCKKYDPAENARLQALKRGPQWLNENLAKKELENQVKNTVNTNTRGTNNTSDVDRQKYASELPYLTQVFKNLAGVNSFRATMSVPSATGNQSTIETEFVRGKGIHATLTEPTIDPLELYFVGDNAFYRSGTSTWLNLASTAEGVKAIGVLKAAMSVDPKGETKTILFSSAIILSVTDEAGGCKRYVVTQYDENGDKQNLDICVKNSLPSTISTISAGGVSNISYRDLNQPIPFNPPKL